MKNILSVLMTSLLFTGCATSNAPMEVNQKYEVVNTLLKDKVNVYNAENLPKLSKNTYDNFSALVNIELIENHEIREGAIALRIFSQYNKTDKCIIMLNFTDKTFSQDGASNDLVKLGMTYYQQYNFIYLHEIAHCMDNQEAPKNVVLNEWKESLADAYSTITLLQNHSLDTSTLSKVATYRRTPDAKAANIIMRYILDNKELIINKKNTPDENLALAFELRRKLIKN